MEPTNELIDQIVEQFGAVQQKLTDAYDQNTEQLRALTAEVQTVRATIGTIASLMSALMHKLTDIEARLPPPHDEDDEPPE